MAEMSKQLYDVVRRMDGNDMRDGALARQELAEMGPVAIARLVADLQNAPRARKKFSMLLIGLRIVALPILVAGAAIAALLLIIAATDGAAEFFGVGCMGDLFSGWNLREQYHESLHQRRWNQIARVLAKMDDLRVAGPLAEALEYADTETQPTLRSALLRLLPQFTPAAARCLTPTQRQALYGLADTARSPLTGRDTGFCLMLLRVFVLGEDTGAIPVVSNLVKSAPNAEVHAAALQTLEQLRVISERQQISRSLLRGASAPVSAPDMLLRPAQAGGTTDPQQLLRPDASALPLPLQDNHRLNHPSFDELSDKSSGELFDDKSPVQASSGYPPLTAQCLDAYTLPDSAKVSSPVTLNNTTTE